MESQNMFEKYPILEKGHELHLSPRGGTLFADFGLVPLGHEEAGFLSACDGTRRLAEIVPAEWSENYGDVKFLMLVSSLASAGRIRFADQPSPASLRITGSSSAYFPPHMSIELTACCNLRCGHCYRNSDSTQHQHMPTDRLLTTLRNLSRVGLRSVELTGGEPTMHKDFIGILDFCAGAFELVGVLSNGTILTAEMVDRFKSMGDQLVLSVSLDGSTPELHNRRRGAPDAFQRTARNLASLTREGIKVRVSMTVDGENFADLENTLLLARELGAIAFSYSPVLPIGRGQDCAQSLWHLESGEVLHIETNLAEKYKGFLSGLSSDVTCKLEDEENCGGGWRTYAMDPAGRVRPCPTYGPDDLVIGNLLEQDITEVFGHPVTMALAEMPVPSKEICGDCRLGSFCRYCGLRGFYGSRIVSKCTWVTLPVVQEVLRYCSTAAGKKTVAAGQALRRRYSRRNLKRTGTETECNRCQPIPDSNLS